MIITLQTLIFFRQTVLNVLDRILRPYYNKLSVTFGKNSDITEEEESEEQVFSEFDDEKGVVFYPPVYLQRYAAVSDCLLDERWSGKLHKVVELGYHDLSFIKYLKEVPGIRCILAVDIESAPLRCSTDLMGCEDYGPKRDSPLQITLFQGNAADPDYRLIGCDAVIAIEMIEHMLPHDLDRLIHTVFGFIKPWIVIFTTPNADFNVLFKALGKNGLRRWDHYFEWTREQFHDWCSNIVHRYQNYSVSCKGIGPGPPGTIHLGCCSQMALFISKDYSKQQDLSMNSLALVSGNAPNREMYNVIDTWDKSQVPSDSNMLFQPDNIDSFAEFSHTFEHPSENKSCLAIMYTSEKNSNIHYSVDTESLLRKTAISLAPFAQHDKASQCNLDAEICKNYKMLDYEQMCYDIVVPRNQLDVRVYMIEDVNNRLNCTSIHVKSFSKTTQNLINKNKDLALVHTREVVDEIRHLTKMLNFNKDSMSLETQENGVQLWRNINWGVDAPYWNQYYKVVKEYNSPYEIKSEECRITELISDEINRLIDSQFDDIDLNRLEIPIEQLMPVVSHITNDVEKVKDLLEWDGYEIVDNLVVHSRIVVDTISTRMTNDDDWPENETYSDWESTEVRSTTLSDGSTMVSDHHAAKCLRHALDQKVRKLRTMLTADEDISTELDKVVCKLMKLALRTSEGRRQPPPSKWLQCKLLDLLTLTEKAIQRRKRHSVENTISQSVKALDFTALEKIKEDDTASKIVDKYKYLVQTGNPRAIKDSGISAGIYGLLNGEFDDDLSVPSADYITNYKFAVMDNDDMELEPNLQEIALLDPTDKKSKLERTQAWLEEDVKPTEDRSSNIEMNFDNDVSSGGDTEHSTSHRYYKESYRRYKKKNKCIELKCVSCKKSNSKVFENDSTKHRASKNQSSKTKLVKKVSKKKSTSNNIATDCSTKYVSVGYRQYRVKSRKKEKPLQPTASKPIPASIIELCHPELVTNNIETYNDHQNKCIPDEHVTPSDQTHGISATEHSNLIEIITAETHETIAMIRTIGTGSEEAMTFENESVIRENVFDKHDAEPEDYQTIFLNDINEPSTSKGIRHISMDVQCGPDVSAPDYLLSATTSTRMNSVFRAGIRIGSSSSDIKVQNTFNCTVEQLKSTTNCCTSTYFEDGNFGMITPRKLTTGIKIKDTPSGAEQVGLPITLEQDSMTDRQGSPIYVKQPTVKAKSTDYSSKVQDTFNCTNAQLKSTTNSCTSTDFEGDFGILKLGSLRPNKPLTGIKIKDKSNSAEQMESLVTLQRDSRADKQRSPIPVIQLTERAKSADCSGSSAVIDRRATVLPISNLPRLRHTSKLQKSDMLKRELRLMPLKQGPQSPQSDKTTDMGPILDSPKLKRRSLIPQKQDSPTRKSGSPETPKSISPIRREIYIALKNESIIPRLASPSVKQKQPTKRKVISPTPGYKWSNTPRPESRREQEHFIAPRAESPFQICKKSKIPRLDSPREKKLTPMIRQQESPVRNNRYSMIPRRESPNKLGSPTRLYVPSTENSPNRLNSPNRQNAPSRHNSTNRFKSPDRYNVPKRLSSNRLNSPNQYLYRKSKSPTIGKASLQRSKSPIQTTNAMYGQKPSTQNRNSPDMHYKPTTACELDFSFGKDREIDCINSILSVPPTRNLNLPHKQKELPTVAHEREFNCIENQEIGLKDSNVSINTKFSGVTKSLKSVPSSIKMDSSSEFYSSFASIPKTTISVGTCDLNNMPFIKKDVEGSKTFTRYIRPKLCYGGVQVHSYRDKESSEDVMFQGEWQNYRPKVFAKRRICNPVKRITESISKRRICSKEKISVTSYLRKNIPTPQKFPAARKIEQVKMNQSVVKTEYIPKADGNIKKPFRNVVKAPSKLTMGSVSPKYNTKSVFLVINPSKAIPTFKEAKQTNKKLTTTKYLPSYLRKNSSEKKIKPKTRDKCVLNLSQHSSKTYVSTKINCPKHIVRSHAEKIKTDLLKLQNSLATPNYIVLRNEIEQNSSNNRTPKKTDSGKKRCDPSLTRNLSPQSQHSSTCSSNSVATVRAVASLSKNVSSHRHFNSSYRSSTANSSSESSTPNRNKKFIKRCKNQKIPDEKKFDNKENIPQTSRQPNSCGSKGSDNKSKGAFPTQQKVFVAHLKESPPLHAANKKPKSNVNLTKTDSLIEKRSKSPTISRVSSLKSEDLIPTHENTIGASTGTSNMVLVLETQRTQHAPSTSTPMRDVSHLTADWMNNTSCDEGKILQVENVETAMKNLVVKALDFIDDLHGSCSSISSSTVILKGEDNNNALLDLTSSLISFKTVITNDEDTSLQNNLEKALYHSLDNESSSSIVSLTADTRMTVTDFDMASFKSSTTFSKHSSHGSARSSRLILASNSVSVKDIYERKDQPFAPVPQNNASAVANQAFSGFSLDVDLIGGDKPDPINRIDSETGSFAAGATRQANSEELFVSGRSSDSFQSCAVDDDAVVPGWLFQIISQQQVTEDDEPAPPLPVMLPLPDNAMFDVNGNDSIGMGAGAGDGRGIHSDPSQDSSGRGTSLSSSVTSSGQSGAILLDPSAFVAQFEGGAAMLQDSEDSSIVIVGVTEDGYEIVASGPIQSQSVLHATPSINRESRRRQVDVASDADADVSSLDTDVPDSS